MSSNKTDKEHKSIVDTKISNMNNGDNNQAIPKKRGRKPKIKQTDEQSKEIKEPKKRGRKPKTTKTIQKEILQPRRRGRKPKDKFNDEQTDFNEYKNIINQDENVIIKLSLGCLDLQDDNLTDNLYQYNPDISEPKPFDEGESEFATLDSVYDTEINELNSIQDNTIESTNDMHDENELQGQKTYKLVKTDIAMDDSNIFSKPKLYQSSAPQPLQQPPQQDTKPRQIDMLINERYNCNNEKINVLNELVNKENRPASTKILCFWCGCNFDNSPWGIPTKYSKGKFDLYGIFCTPQCTLSHLITREKDDDYLWEKVALLNLLYFKVYGKYENLTPALDKIALTKYGGSLEEDQYRDIICQNEKSYSIEFPPCNNVIPTLEDIYKKSNLNATFIPIDKNRIKKAGEELKLKRTKPINYNKKTLDDCMNINA